MDTWQMIGALLIALVLGGTLAYIFWRERSRAARELKEGPKSTNNVNPLQMQLQAYERLILLTERIALPNLISRTNQPGIAGKDMQMMLTHTIRQEFDHNVTQQLYVSSEAWDAIRNLKEQNIHIINQVASYLPPDVSGADLNKQLLEMIAKNPKMTLHNVVAEVLSFEAKKTHALMDKPLYNDSGIEINKIYSAGSPSYFPLDEQPGEFPFTRGVQPDMYRGKPWTMRQYAGFSTAEESNKRYHYLLDHGVTGLSVAFDLPTQIGYNSDHVLSEGEVGKVGVAIDSLEDMQTLFNGINLEQVSTSMTINATGFILLALYVAVAKQQGAALTKLNGTIQNDILKEYAARGTYIYPPKPSMRIITDIFEWCSTEVPKWNTISISGYHIREAGSTAVQEIAFTLSNGKAYVKAAIEKGLDINVFGKRLSFFFNAHNNLFEEVAKFRAARRMWAKIMKDLGATDPKAMMLRFHAQTGGSTLTAQQPLNNISRVTVQTLAAVLGGTQSLHTNGYDEALSLPTEQAARIALRTQQIVAFESGSTETVDPLAGSYYVESLTNDVEREAMSLIQRIDAMGGSVTAIEQGFIQEEIARSAYAYQRKVESNEKIIVGVNKFTSDEKNSAPGFRIDDSIRQVQTEKLAALKRRRDHAKVDKLLQALNDAASSDENIMPAVLEAVENLVTLGEISDTLREIFGEHR